jgi:hypothetical protein
VATCRRGIPVTETTFECARDRHLFGPGRKQILALDGGGVRGAITVAFLERIESILSRQHGKDIRLGDHFDLIGGTSTGAIIAGALALGYRAAEIKEFYTRLAPLAFKREFWRIPVLQAKFDAHGLRQEIAKIVGDRELSSQDLITGLCVVTKRMDTGSPWILANNPRAPYWNDGPNHDGNKHYRLANLVRASTAAPHFFDPEILPITGRTNDAPADSPAGPLLDSPWLARHMAAILERLHLRRKPLFDPKTHGLFIDGGVTPHNNPSFALLQMAILKAFGICWTPGPDQLSVTSVGTGSYRPRLSFEKLGFTRFAQLAIHALMSVMSDAETMILAQMQWLGECPQPWVINSEVGTLAGDGPPGGKMFRFLRYDVRLEQNWLADELDVKVDERELERFRCMDDPGIVSAIYDIAVLAAKKQIKPEHWGAPAAP